MFRIALLVLAALVITAGVGSSQQRYVDVAIVIGGDAYADACGTIGVVVGLNPRGDGFLAVRSGPGAQTYREIDRLYNGNEVYLCGQHQAWIAVVYSVDGRDCGVGTPWPARRAYNGPCRYGWVHSRYIRETAG